MIAVKIIKVAGHSMFPTLNEGQYVLIGRWHGIGYKVNDIVVVLHPKYGRIIKRITMRSNEHNRYLLGGDNISSTSSKKLGWIEHDWVIGKVIWTI